MVRGVGVVSDYLRTHFLTPGPILRWLLFDDKDTFTALCIKYYLIRFNVNLKAGRCLNPEEFTDAVGVVDGIVWMFGIEVDVVARF